jgi:hypothetical protein
MYKEVCPPFSDRSNLSVGTVDDPRSGLLRHLFQCQLLTNEEALYVLQTLNNLSKEEEEDVFVKKEEEEEEEEKKEEEETGWSGSPILKHLKRHGKRLSRVGLLLLRAISKLKRMKNKAKGWRLEYSLWRATLARAAVTGKLPENQQNDVVWEGLLVKCCKEILQCSFWRSLENRQNPFVLLLSKIAPQRCQIRESGETILAKMETFPLFGQAFRQWMDASLFGLYTTKEGEEDEDEFEELSERRQMEFFELTSDPNRHLVFHWWLLKRQDLLCVFLTREYMANLVPQIPGLLNVLERTFNWTEFVRITFRVINQVRGLVNKYGWSILFCGDSLLLPLLDEASLKDAEEEEEDSKKKRKAPRGGSEPPKKKLKKRQKPKNKSNDAPEEAAAAEEEEEYDIPVDCPYKLELVNPLKTNETRSQQQLLVVLDRLIPIYQTLRRHKNIPHTYANMIGLLQAFDQERADQFLEGLPKKKTSMQDLTCCLLGQQEMQKHFYQRHQQDFVSLVYASRNKVPAVSLRVLAELPANEQLNEHGITTRHFAEMTSWIDRCSHMDENKALEEILRPFGASIAGFEMIQKLKIAHESKQGKKTIINGLLQLAIHHQYTYSLLHSFSYLWNRHISFRIEELPKHYIENQIRAIRRRFCLKEKDPIPDLPCTLLVCRVCDHIFSLTATEKTMWIAKDSFGYNNISGCQGTGEQYCSRENVIAHQTVKDVQLTKIWMLGQAVLWRKQLILMCPKCSIQYVYTETCAYMSQYGYVCSACTFSYRQGDDTSLQTSLAKFPTKMKRRTAKTKLNQLSVTF